MKKVKLENLDCASCALKIEKTLGEMEELSNVKLNFSTSTLSFEQNTNKDLLNIIEKEIQKIEKEVFIVKQENKKKKNYTRSFKNKRSY